MPPRSGRCGILRTLERASLASAACATRRAGILRASGRAAKAIASQARRVSIRSFIQLFAGTEHGRHHQLHQPRAVSDAAPAARREHRPRGGRLSRTRAAIYEANMDTLRRLGPRGWDALDVGPTHEGQREAGAAARAVDRTAQGAAHPHARGAHQPGLAPQAQAGLRTCTSSSRSCCWRCPASRPPDAGGPRRGQVLPGLHPVRPVLQAARRGPHLRHRDARGTGGEVAGAGAAARLRAHVVSCT